MVKKGFELKKVCIIIIITAIVTSLTTGLIIYNNSKIILGSTSIKEDEALTEYLRVYNSLDENYYTDYNKTEMIDAAIAAMLDYLGEDYSTYLNQDETDSLSNKLSGKYLGIGISIANGNEILKVYEDTPAAEAGLQIGDKIISVNNENTTEKTQAEVSNMINKTKENEIVIDRNGEYITFNITAAEINMPLTREIIEYNNRKIGYIYISSFTNTVGEEFAKSLRELENEGMESLIIDVRENTGGYLKGATEIASQFIEKGKILYSLESKESVDEYKDETDEYKTYKVAILVSENTASASEVLTAALKDSYGAVVVGKTTYGKGRVQQTRTLEDGSMVKYTTAKWLRPNGECIDGIGIIPDFDVDIIQNEDGTYTDQQMNTALEQLSM